jgi:hypothetical protein
MYARNDFFQVLFGQIFNSNIDPVSFCHQDKGLSYLKVQICIKNTFKKCYDQLISLNCSRVKIATFHHFLRQKYFFKSWHCSLLPPPRFSKAKHSDIRSDLSTCPGLPATETRPKPGDRPGSSGLRSGKSAIRINTTNFFNKYFLGQCLYWSFSTQKTMHIKSKTHNSIAMFFFLKTLHTWRDSKPGQL